MSRRSFLRLCGKTTDVVLNAEGQQHQVMVHDPAAGAIDEDAAPTSYTWA
jgi:hypothetical protein